jgi:S-adenosylmethionine:tRNA ribosyltransferase-isomerase
MTRVARSPIDLADYDFELPPEQIAQHALPQRDQARLLRLDRTSGEILSKAHDAHVCDLPSLLRAGDLIVVNTTRVVPARLFGHKDSGGGAEALVLGPHGDPARAEYRALIRISGRLRTGLRFTFAHADDRGARATADAELVAFVEPEEPDAPPSRGECILRFDAGVSPYDVGEAPLPPYIRRTPGDPRSAADLERYQTVYAREPGAVAAPTAGLHLTQALFSALDAAGIGRADVVLHVGAGTFRPLSAENLHTGRLHRETYVLPAATADAIAQTRERGGRVIAVGTTSARVLESCAREGGLVEASAGETDLFLYPGQPFRVVDGLLTNFHLPRSSLLLLVAAFAGRAPVMAAYRAALAAGYRFYSYGDAMLIV